MSLCIRTLPRAPSVPVRERRSKNLPARFALAGYTQPPPTALHQLANPSLTEFSLSVRFTGTQEGFSKLLEGAQFRDCCWSWHPPACPLHPAMQPRVVNQACFRRFLIRHPCLLQALPTKRRGAKKADQSHHHHHQTVTHAHTHTHTHTHTHMRARPPHLPTHPHTHTHLWCCGFTYAGCNVVRCAA
jgi:hypothetical protein